jgi:hypothetical protein
LKLTARMSRDQYDQQVKLRGEHGPYTLIMKREEGPQEATRSWAQSEEKSWRDLQNELFEDLNQVEND